MGINLISCCHKCKQQERHLRMRESETILPFYQRHYDCMVEDRRNVETLEGQIQQEDWMGQYEELC